MANAPTTLSPDLDSLSRAVTLPAVPDENLADSPPAAMLAEVHVYVDGVLAHKYAIEPGEYIIGRDATCHVVVNAEQVSRHHARLTFNAFELLVEDLGSSNGVFIDGVQVQIPTRVRPDQEVQIGSARLYIRLHEETQQHFRAALWDKDLGLESVRQMLAGAKYKVVTTIARGGMGVVMQARDLHVRRTVAMKVMKTTSQFSRENVLRFIDEAQLTGQLEHPNIVPVYELAIDEQGETFYTMKFVRGITLDEVLRGLRHGNEALVKKYPLALLVTIFLKICDGVAYAHSKGVVHRDLKPENVMIGGYGEVMVMDWGLAKNMTGAQRKEGAEPGVELVGEQPLADARGFQTMHGLVVGTPPYISPEQARGELDKIDARSDIFVLGEILYAILTLRVPFSGSTVGEVIEDILASKVTPPTSFSSPPKSTRKLETPPNADDIALPHLPGGRVPESLGAVAMKAMALDPEKRYQSVEEMQADITAFQGGFATKAERATVFKQVLLWAGRHKREVTLIVVFAIVFHVAVGTFFFSLKRERDLAVKNYKLAVENERLAKQNAERARRSEIKAAEAIEDLRQTAPTFASDAEALLEDLKLGEALEKIDYAIEQQPQSAEFWVIKGNILQSMLKLGQAKQAYEKAVSLSPKVAGGKMNLDLTNRLLASLGADGKPTVAGLKDLQQSMLAQKRTDEAFGILRQLTADREQFRKLVLDSFGKLGLKDRVEANDDATVNLDLSGMDLTKGFFGPQGPRRAGMGGLRELRNRPIVSLNLDGTRIADLTAVKGWKLEKLSINNDPVSDLRPLTGMPLRSLSADGCPVADLSPLQGMPLDNLRLRNNSRISDLSVLKGMPLENLVLSGCREVKDIAALAGLPLQQLDLSRSGVTDLRPLVQSPLRELNLEGCTDLTDLTPLAEMQSLEAVIIPKHCKDIDFLREHPSLRRLSTKKMTETVYEFWRDFDRR